MLFCDAFQLLIPADAYHLTPAWHWAISLAYVSKAATLIPCCLLPPLTPRALDYLFGFHLSPLLWRKVPGARSAGRVQSVALRLVCEREAAIEAFEQQLYYTVEAELQLADGGAMEVRTWVWR